MTIPNLDPFAGGDLARGTDGIRGMWMTVDNPQSPTQPTQPNWFSVTNEIGNVKQFGAWGDGVRDDTAAFRAILAAYTLSGLIYVPPGTYKLTAQLTWPSTAGAVIIWLAPGVTMSGTGALPLPTLGNRVVYLNSFGADHSTLGGDNTWLGVNAIASNLTGFSLTAIGYNALVLNTAGVSNTAVGSQSLAGNIAGNYNTALGSFAAWLATGSANADLGYKAGQARIAGDRNTNVGNSAGFDATSGDDNYFGGYNAGDGCVSGSQNVALGSGALLGAAVNASIALGYLASNAGNNAIAIGANVSVTSDNQCVIGGAGIQGFGFGGQATSLGSGGTLFHLKGGASGSGYQASSTSVTDGAVVGYLDLGTTGTGGSEKRAAAIQAALRGSAASSITGELVFYTTTAGTLAERMHLDVNGVTATGLGVSAGGSTTISTGVGSVKMSTANAATNTAWIPLRYAGTTYYVPAFTTNAP